MKIIAQNELEESTSSAKSKIDELYSKTDLKNANDIKNTALANEVRRYKETETGVDKMCKLMQDLAKQEIKEVAKNFLMAGADIDLVVNGTKLSREEVEEIAQHLEKKTA